MNFLTVKLLTLQAIKPIHLTLVYAALTASPVVHAFSYDTDVRLQDLVETTKLSGFEGTDIVVGASEEGHAMTGLSTAERWDKPCSIGLSTESTNESGSVAEIHRNWCGSDPSSLWLPLSYSNKYLNQPRLFVSGIRLCMNRSSRRLKGYQLAGKRISDTGFAQEIPHGGYSVLKNGVSTTPSSPLKVRINCSSSDWMNWASCSRLNQVATGVVVHLSAGKTPRSITGIALRCQIVSAVRQ